MTRWLGRAILVTLLVLVAISSLLATLAASERGTRFMVDRAVSLLSLPVTLQGLQGSLLSGMQIQRLSYAADTLQVDMDDVSLAVDWWFSLLNDRLRFERVVTQRVDVRTSAGPAEPAERTIVLPALPVDVEVGALDVGQLVVNDLADDQRPRIQLAGQWTQSEVVLTDVAIEAERYGVDGRLSITVGADPQVDAAFGARVRIDREYVGAVTLAGPLARLVVSARLETPWRVDVDGHLAPLGAEPEVDATLTAPQLDWNGYAASDVVGELAGTLAAYRGRMVARVSTPFDVTGQVSGSFSGDSGSLSGRELLVGTNVGRATGSFALAWRPSVSVDFSARVEELNPAHWREGVEGMLAADVEGRFESDELTVDLTGLNGNLQGHAVDGAGRLRWHAGTLDVTDVELAAGSNRASGSGRWAGEDLDAAVSFDVRTPELLVPGLSGDVKGALELARKDGVWAGDGTASAARLEYGSNSLEGLRLEAHRTASGNNTVTIASDAVQVANVVLREVTASANGPDEHIEAQTRWSSAAGPGEIFADITLAEETMATTVQPPTRFAVPGGTWSIGRSTRVTMGAQRVEAEAHCWRMDDASVCVDAMSWQGTDLRVAGRVDTLPLRSFAWLDPLVQALHGTLQGEWSFVRESDAWRGNGRLATTGLGLDETGTGEDTIDLPDVAAIVVASTTGIEATVSAGEPGRAVLEGELSMAGTDATAPLDGWVRVQLHDLTPLSTVSERLTNTRGKLDGRLEIGGTVRQPSVRGQVRLTDGGLEWLEPHLALDEMNVRLDLEDDRMSLAGSAHAPGGRVRLEGTGEELFSATRRVQVNLTGETVTVQLPDMEIAVAPELDLVWFEGLVDLKGRVRIPRANIKVTQLPEGATPVSPDVVVEGRTDAPADAARLAADLQVVLGDDVHLAALGLQTRLTGSLRLRQSRSGEVSLLGRMDLKDGEYSAYGRKLAIESGRLIFQGPPGDPDVDVRAVRTIQRPEPEGKIVVGVHVTGKVSALESTLFSEPAMSEADALSYLVVGRPLNQATESEGEELSGAAVALGLAQTTGIVNQIRRTVGLDELGAGTSPDQQTTVVAGKQLGSNLYARYTYNTFTRLSALLLRLDLTTRLSLEAIAGEAPGMDLIYRVGSQ